MTGTLISGLGGSAGFGENVISSNDDGSTAQIDITSIFEDGLNFFGNEFTGLWINNNGGVTFNGSRTEFTPTVITANNGNPEITPFFADVDTRGGPVVASSGGNSTGSNLVYYDFDTENDRFIITWDDVGYFNNQNDLLNAFQLVLTDQGDGDFDIQFRYEDINWTTGDQSGGTGGLGGTVARAGFTNSTGNPNTQFELPASGNQAGVLALDETPGNTGEIGIWEFSVRSGDLSSNALPEIPVRPIWGITSGDPHLITLDGAAYDFHAAGEFVLLRATNGLDFQIQARMTPVEGSDNLTVNSAFAMKLGSTNVMIDATDSVPVSVGGTPTEVPNFSSISIGNDAVFRANNVYTFVFAGDDGVVGDGDSQIVITAHDGRLDFEAHLADSLLGNLEGLLGDGNGDPENDIALRDGTPLARPLTHSELYGQYREDWRVKEAGESLFTYDAGESLAGFFIESYPASIASLDDFAADQIATAISALTAAGLTEGTVAFNNALLDFLATGDTSYIEAGLDSPELSTDSTVPVAEGVTDQTLVGTAGNDKLFAGPGNDTLTGDAGRDLLEGRAGNDSLDGGPGVDFLNTGLGADTATLGRDWDILGGELSELDRDTITDFSSEDLIFAFSADGTASNISFEFNADTGALNLSGGTDGSTNATIMLPSLGSGARFSSLDTSIGTFLQLDPELPALSEGRNVDASKVNGVMNPAFLSPISGKEVIIRVDSSAEASYDNAIGVYEYDESGAISNVRIIADSAKEASSSELSVAMTDGTLLGVFIVQDGAAWAKSLADTAVLNFVNASGVDANIDAAAGLTLMVDGVDAGVTAFHANGSSLNSDGSEHAVSWINDAGDGLMIGIEDQTGGGDSDFQDVLLEIRQPSATIPDDPTTTEPESMPETPDPTAVMGLNLEGTEGNDTLRGGVGNDTITGFSGDDLMFGGLGEDKFVFEGGFALPVTGFGSIFSDGFDSLELSTDWSCHGIVPLL